MDSTIASANIRIDADTTAAQQAIKAVSSSLRSMNSNLNSLVPGTQTVNKVLSRISGGFYQLVQGTTRYGLQNIADAIGDIAKSGYETAETMESAAVAFRTLLPATEDYKQLLTEIEQTAVKTPFDVAGLTTSTQKLVMVTNNGAEAKRTIENLGKAITAAGRGDAELTRMATNLQQIGANAFVSARDIREFGNAGVDILGMVSDYTGKAKEEVEDYLKSIKNPYEVITAAINAAGEGSGKFAKVYEESAQTIGQASANLQDSLGIFGEHVLETSGILEKLKDGMKAISDQLSNTTNIGTVAESFNRLIKNIDVAGIIDNVFGKIFKVFAAFNTGQFDNIVVFFKELVNTIKQFSGFQTISRVIKVILDLFSDNHTAEEVQKVAHQLGNLIRVLLEFKFALTVAKYMNSFAEACINVGRTASLAISGITRIGSSIGGLSVKPIVLVIAGIAALVAIIATLDPKGFDSFVKNIAEGFNNVLKFIGDVANEFINVGQNIIVGLWNGLVEGFNAVIGKIQEMAQAIANAFKSALGIHSPSTVMRDEVGKNISAGIAEGIVAGQSSINAAMDLINKNFGLSGDELVEQAEELLEKLASLQEQWLNNLQGLGAIDTVEQIQLLRKFASQYEANSKARIALDEKIADLEIDIAKEITDLVDDFNTQFSKAVSSAKSYYDIFEYTQSNLTRTTASVIEGLRRQNDNMASYYKNLAAINRMGFDSDFLQEIMDQGMDAAAEVAGLANATQDEIDEINRLWSTRGTLATDIAKENTKELREETLKEVEYLQSGMENKIVDVYDTGELLVSQFTSAIYDTMPTLNDALVAMTDSLKSASESAAKSSADAASEIAEVGDVASSGVADLEDYTGALGKLDIEAFDTTDILSLMKNMLSSIPWYIYAIGAVTFGGKLLSAFGQAKNGAAGAARGVSKLGDMVSVTFSDSATNILHNTKSASMGAKAAFSEISASSSTAAAGIQSNFAKTGTGIGGQFTAAAKTADTSMKSMASSASANLDLINDTFDKSSTRNVTTIRGSADSVKKILTDESQSTTSKLLEPFEKFNTRLKGFNSSVSAVFDSLANIVTSFVNSVFTIINNLVTNILGVVQRAAAGIMNIIRTITAGIGQAIADMLMPLSNPQLLQGVAVILGLAAAMVVFAVAANACKVAGFEGLAMFAAFAVTIGVLAIAAAQLAFLAPQILIASVAIAALGVAIGVFGVAVGAAFAAIGVGIAIAAASLTMATQMAQNINIVGLVLMGVGIALMSKIFAMILPLVVPAAIASTCMATIGAGLLIAGGSLMLASQLGSQINIGGIIALQVAIVVTSIILDLVSRFAIFGAIGAIATAVLSVGLLVTALGLWGASVAGAQIDEEGLKKVLKSVTTASLILAVISGFAVLGAVGAIASAVISGGLLLSALALKTASEIGPQIDLDGLNKIEEAVSRASLVMAGISIIAGFAAVGSLGATVVATSLLIIADCLAKASLLSSAINLGSFDKMQQAIDKLVAMNFGNFFETLAKANISENVAKIAENVYSIVHCITEAMTELAQLDKYTDGQVDNYRDKVVTIVEKIAAIEVGTAEEAEKKADASEHLSDLSERIATIINKVSEMVKTLAELSYTVSPDQVSNYVDSAKNIVTQISSLTLNDEKDGLFSKTNFEKTADAAEQVSKTAEKISSIVNSVKGIIDILSEFSTLADGTVEQYIEDAKEITNKFAEIKIEQENLEATATNAGHVATMATNVNSILDATKNIVNTIKEWVEGLGISTVKDYIVKANGIIEEVAKMALPNEVEPAYEQTAENTGYVKTMAGNVSETITSVDNIVTTIQKWVEGIGLDKVKQYIGEANNIVIEVSHLADEGRLGGAYQTTAEHTNQIKTMATNVADIIGNVDKIVTTIKTWYDSGIDKEKIKTYVNDANEIIAKVGELAAPGKLSGAYDKTAENVGHINSMVGTVNEILEKIKTLIANIKGLGVTPKDAIAAVSDANGIVEEIGSLALPVNKSYKKLSENLGFLNTAIGTVINIIEGCKTMFAKVKEFNEQFPSGDVAFNIQCINSDLETIAGEYGLKFPENSNIDAEMVTKLGFVVSALEKIKQVAEAMCNVPSVGAEQLANIGAIIEFIKTKMAELPTVLANYTQDFTNQGNAFAEAFINGWSSQYGNMETAGHEAQSRLWSAIESHMQDEYYQGAYLAEKVINGIESKYDSFYNAGGSVQGKFWSGIQHKFQDEYYQGQALTGEVLSGINSKLGAAEEQGRYVSQGFANGINNEMWRVNQAAGNLSETAINKLRQLLRIASPSKVMEQLGGYVSQGFADGITDKLGQVRTAGEALADAVMSGYDSTIQPMTATVDAAAEWNNAHKYDTNGNGGNTSNVIINQNNNVYNDADMSKTMSDLVWAVTRA